MTRSPWASAASPTSTPSRPPHLLETRSSSRSPGFTFTEAEVELCAGSNGQSANPLYWRAFLADNTGGGDVVRVRRSPRSAWLPAAARGGWVAFEVPDGSSVASVVLTDQLFAGIGRWTTASAVSVSSPLAPASPPTAGALGSTADIGGGATAVVRSVTPNAPPTNEFFGPSPGRQLVEVSVELCAGSAPLAVNPLYWLLTGEDSVTGSASLR